MRHESFAADSALVHALLSRSVPVPCREGHTLFKQGDIPSGLYILRQGEATLLMKSLAGRPVLCLQADSGSLLGLPAVLGNEPYTLTAIIRKGSDVQFITREDFLQVIQEQPALYSLILEMLAKEVSFARRAFAEG
jgi:CRP-like cAMP-binding protein